jgi:hypothetical protein
MSKQTLFKKKVEHTLMEKLKKNKEWRSDKNKENSKSKKMKK